MASVGNVLSLAIFVACAPVFATGHTESYPWGERQAREPASFANKAEVPLPSEDGASGLGSPGGSGHDSDLDFLRAVQKAREDSTGTPVPDEELPITGASASGVQPIHRDTHGGVIGHQQPQRFRTARVPAQRPAADNYSYGPTPWIILSSLILAAACFCYRSAMQQQASSSYSGVPKEIVEDKQAKADVQMTRTDPGRAPFGGPGFTLPQGENQWRPPPGKSGKVQEQRSCWDGGEDGGMFGCSPWGAKKQEGRNVKCQKCGWACRCPGCKQADDTKPVLAWREPRELEGKVERIIAEMRDYSDDAERMKTCLSELQELALEHECQKKIGKLGGIEAIVAAMKRHRNVQEIQKHGCWTLGNLALRVEEVQRQIASSGGITEVIEAMTLFNMDVMVQEKGCWALQQLAMTADNRKAITELGGIQHIVWAMQTHVEDLPLAENGALALGNLAFEPDTRLRIQHENGIKALIHAMSAHLEKREDARAVHENCCFALHNMACSDDCMADIVDSNGIQAITHVMSKHPDVASVQQNACGAMHNINCGNTKYVQIAAHCNAIELVLQAMKRHSDDPAVCHKAIHVLGQLGDRVEEVRQRIIDSGAIQEIEAARKKFGKSKDVQHASKEALTILKN